MCIRFGQQGASVQRWAGTLGVAAPPQPMLSDGDAFPGSDTSIVVPGEEGREMILARWGLTPHWAKEASFGRKNAYNARSETIAEKPTFRSAFRHRRCVVPATAIYERAEGRWLRLVPSEGEVFSIAGLFEPPNEWTDGLPTFTMATTEPNTTVGEVHDRMPVVLAPDDLAGWMNPDADLRELHALLVPCPSEWIQIEDAGPITRKAKSAEPGALF